MHTIRIRSSLRRGLLVALAAAAAVLSAVSAGPAAAAGLPPDWVAQGSGEFTTHDSSDYLSYRIERDAVSQDVVEFKLEATNKCMWRKVLVMPDGQGSQWDIIIEPIQGTFEATNGLWANQVHNGQHLELWKAGFWGNNNRWVLNIGHLDDLPPGSRVVFRWLADGGRYC